MHHITPPQAAEVLQRNYSIHVDRSTWHNVNDNRRPDEDLCDAVNRIVRERRAYLFLALSYFALSIGMAFFYLASSPTP